MTDHEVHETHVHEETTHVREEPAHVHDVGHGHGSYFGGTAAWMIAMVLVVVFAIIVIFGLIALVS